MLKDRELINNILNLQITKYQTDKNVVSDVTDMLVAKGLLPADVNNIFSKRQPVEILSEQILILFTIVFYEVTKEPPIKPEILFNQNEIRVAQNIEVQRVLGDKFPLTLAPAIEVLGNKQWITRLSLQQIMDLVNRMIINYNPETQREGVVKTIGDNIITAPKIKASSVRAVKNNILKNRQYSNTITLNVEFNENSDIEYDEKNLELVINNGDIDIIDGWHRLRAMIQAYTINREVEYVSEVRITNFTIEEAQGFIVQEDKRNPINKTHIKSLDTTNYANLIAKRLNDDSKSLLRGKIVTNKYLINNRSGLVMFDKLIDVISLTFNPNSTIDVLKHGGYILDGLNALIYNNVELLEDSSQAFWIAAIVNLYSNFKSSKPPEGISMNIEDFKDIDINIVNKKTIKKLEDRMMLYV